MVESEDWLNSEVKQSLEANQSMTIRAYYKGYSILVTKRDDSTKILPLIEDAMKAIDWMMTNPDFKPSWDTTEAKTSANATCEICGKPAQDRRGTTKAGKPYHAIFCQSDKAHVKWL